MLGKERCLISMLLAGHLLVVWVVTAFPDSVYVPRAFAQKIILSFLLHKVELWAQGHNTFFCIGHVRGSRISLLV